MTATDDATTDDHAIADAAALRARYRDPHELVLRKQLAVVDDAAAGFVAASPFFVLATTSPRGTDASPRGGPPGFVTVLDEHHLAWGDLSGNNRLDSFGNIVEHPEVGLLFFLPGEGETLRVNGRASLTDHPDVLDRTTLDGRRPKVAVVVEVSECYIHCAKAIRRSGLWEPERWAAADERPKAAQVLVENLDLDVDADVVAAGLEADYAATLWEAGGA